MWGIKPEAPSKSGGSLLCSSCLTNFSPTRRSRNAPRGKHGAAAALNHLNVCTIYEVGEHEDRPFIAMKLMEGVTLNHRIEANAIKPNQGLDLAVEIKWNEAPKR